MDFCVRSHLLENILIDLFVIKKTKSGYFRIPFVFPYTTENGNLIIPENYQGIVGNMDACYNTCIYGGSDFYTKEINTLYFFKHCDLFKTVNIYSSLIFTLKLTSTRDIKDLANDFMEIINISDINLIDSNYFMESYKNEEALKLLKIETKIYFWWNIITKNHKITQSMVFVFYKWIITNINRLNKPLKFSGEGTFSEFKRYFLLIDLQTDPINLLFLRYGPLKMTIEELIKIEKMKK